MPSPVPPLLPAPRSVDWLDGAVTLPAGCRVVADPLVPGAAAVADHLVADVHARVGVHVGRSHSAAAGDIELRLGHAAADHPEAYVVHAEGHDVVVTASTAHGLWNGTRTLLQLARREGDSVVLPAAHIVDSPRFEWRGAMLDVARHFFGVDHVKRLIELIAAFKLNRLHVHLTDDQGWRLEIPAYPALTTVGGSTSVGGGSGGWYTLEDWAEICEHGLRHHVTVVPEVDMPGHTNAALASLPELNVDGIAPALYTGKEVGFSSLRLDVPGTVDFIRTVLTTVATATPGRYLHIGGDEAHSTHPAQYRQFVELLLDEAARHDVTMIGWEEIATAPLPPGVMVQHWLRPETALAASEGTRFIMSPARHTYLDMRHAPDDPLGRRWAGDIDVDVAYGWDPAGLLPGVDDDHIAGVEAPLWTEKVPDFRAVEHLCFPRLLCLAEVGWSQQASRSWPEFASRLAVHTDRLAARNVNVYRSRLLVDG